MNSTQILVLASSATIVGAIHTLMPGHWVPVALMTRSRRWPLRTAFLGAVVSSAGHIFFSLLFGILAAVLGVQLLASHENEIEKYSGLTLAVFGLIYAAATYIHQKHHCHTAHPHNHDSLQSEKFKKSSPFLFLLLAGMSPCIAILPVFASAAAYGTHSMILSVLGFSFGVIGTLVTATGLASLGLMKLNHPLLEKYGDVVTGAGVFLTGIALFLAS